MDARRDERWTEASAASVESSDGRLPRHAEEGSAMLSLSQSQTLPATAQEADVRGAEAEEHRRLRQKLAATVTCLPAAKRENSPVGFRRTPLRHSPSNKANRQNQRVNRLTNTLGQVALDSSEK